MRKIYILFVFFVICFQLQAQVQELGTSPHFNTIYPENVKLLALKNGNLALIRYHNDKNKLNVHIYDRSHKEIAHKETLPNFGNTKDQYVRTAMETKSGKILVYFSINEKSRVVIYQAFINAQTASIDELKVLYAHDRKAVSQSGLSTDGISFNFEKSESGKYHALYFKNYAAANPVEIQELWVMDEDGNKISSAFINQDKLGKYKKGIGLVGMAINEQGTTYLVTTNYNSISDKKRNFIKVELNKDPVAYQFCPTPNRNVFFYGILKYNPVKDEVIFVLDDFGSNGFNHKFIFDAAGNCQTQPLTFPNIIKRANQNIKTKNKDKFRTNVVKVDINKDGSYLYTIGVEMKREEMHHNSLMLMDYIVGFGRFNEGNSEASFMPTFVNGDLQVGLLEFVDQGAGFSNLKEIDTRGFALLLNDKKGYYIFNDNEKSREKLEDDKNLKRIRFKDHLTGMFAPIEYNNQQIAPVLSIENTNEKSRFFYFRTTERTADGEIAVIKLLDGDKMLVSWLKIQE